MFRCTTKTRTKLIVLEYLTRVRTRVRDGGDFDAVNGGSKGEFTCKLYSPLVVVMISLSRTQWMQFQSVAKSTSQVLLPSTCVLVFDVVIGLIL